MSRTLTLAVLALSLSACTELTSPMGGFQPQYDSWKAVVAQTGIDSKKTVWLGGGELNGITTRAEADALVAANRGKQGSLVGYVHKVTVRGNRAAIEVIRVWPAEQAQRCTGGNYTKTSPVVCIARNKGVWRSAVTCHVNNIADLNRRIGENIKANADARWQRRSAWAHVMVVGTIDRVDTQRVVGDPTSFRADGAFDGVMGGASLRGFAYSNIHINNCRVATYRSKLVPQT